MPIHSLPAPRTVARAAALTGVLACASLPLRAQDTGDPALSYDPGTGTTLSAGTLTVTVRFMDDVSLNQNTRVILFNGANVTGNFTYVPGPTQLGMVTATATGTVTLEPGPNKLWANICDNGSPANCVYPDTAIYTFIPGSPQVRVAPDGGAVNTAAGSTSSHVFRVVNQGTASGTYTLRPECRDAWTGNRLAGCTSAQSVTVPAGDSVNVTVTAPAASAGATQLVRLSAEAGGMTGVADAGWLDVTSTGPGNGGPAAAQVQRVDLNGGPVIERSECVTAAVAPGAAYECGDLRVSHALPTHRTYNREWTPVLLYNSQHAHPMPTVYADVTVPAGSPSPSTVTVNVLVGGVNRSASFPGGQFAPGVPQRVAVQWDGLQTPTGVYPYTLQVFSGYSGLSIPSDTIQGRLVVVNRHNTPYGAGWWLAGWERMYCIDCGTDNELLWVGGDGSTRIFTRTAANRWVAPDPGGAADTLVLANGVYVRTLNGGGQVELDAQGRHVRTVNRLGQAMRFAVSGTEQVDTIHAPVPAGQTPAIWRFTYAWNHVEYIYATTGSNTRRTTFGYYNGQKPMNRIIDPDGVSTWFYYPHEMTPAETYSPRMRQLLDRRSTRHVFAWDTAQKLHTVRLWMDSVPTANDLVRTFHAGEARGVARENTSGMPVPVAQAYTLLDGARTDVADHTLLWLTARGAPRRIRDAMGGETVLNRTDAAFPALVTQVLGPNARGDSLVARSTAVYDAKGRITSNTVHNPLGDGVNQATTYGWNDAVNRPDWIQAPGSGLVRFAYDSTTRNPRWQQQGDSLRRVHFDYNAAGQVIRVRYPHPTAGYPASGGRDSMVYDAKGNLRRTVSPLGFVTLYTRDGQGRVTETRSPVHANSSSDSASVANTGLRQTVAYTVMDRDTLQVTYGRAMTFNRQSLAPLVMGTAAETVRVRKTYDRGGLPLTVQRWSMPDTAGVGVLTTTYTYDRAGRKTTESNGVDETETFAYDPAGNLLAHLSSGVNQVDMRYDALGRLTRRVVPLAVYTPEDVDCADGAWPGCVFHFPSFPNGGMGHYLVRSDTALFGYDAAGNMVRAENGDAIVSRTYYPGGALATDSLRIRTWDRARADLHVYGVAYAYDAAGRMRALEHPRNLTGGWAQADQYRYDPVTGAVDTVISRVGLRFSFQQDLLGRVVADSFPGGYNLYRYDLEGRRVAREGAYLDSLTYDARGKVLQATLNGTSHSYNYYSGLGNLVATEWRNDFNFAQEVDEYQLDGLGHTVWTRTVRDGGNHPEYRYTYSPGSSRVTRIHNVLPATYVDSLQFTRDTTWRTYDEGGNLQMGAKRSWRSDRRKIQTRPYFGADGHLRAEQGYEEMNGTAHLSHERRGYFTEHRYDALGRRVLTRTRRDGLCYKASTTIADCTGGITRYVWEGDNILWEMRGPGADSVQGARLNDISAPGQEFGIVGYTHADGVDRPLVVWKGGDVVVPHTNWRGVYGKGTGPGGGATTVPIEWPGFKTTAYHRMGPSQQATTNWMGSLIGGHREPGGTMYMRNRYYDPQTGQFTRRDPIGVAGGLNTYGFAAGDPVNGRDPFGTWCKRESDERLRCTNVGAQDFYTIRDFLGGESGEHAFATFSDAGLTQWNHRNCYRMNFNDAQCTRMANALSHLTLNSSSICSGLGESATRRFHRGLYRYTNTTAFTGFNAPPFSSRVRVSSFIFRTDLRVTLAGSLAHEEGHMKWWLSNFTDLSKYHDSKANWNDPERGDYLWRLGYRCGQGFTG